MLPAFAYPLSLYISPSQVTNHGFINRDGMGLVTTDLAEALTKVFGVDISFHLNVMSSQSLENLRTRKTIDLFSWYGQFDHDASLVRKDQSPMDLSSARLCLTT